jgi:iron(III) transport system substrate-binding protein
MKKGMLLGLLMMATLSACTLSEGSEESITLFTQRHYDVDQQLYDQFYEETGIKVNIVSANADELMNRLATEGEDTTADVLLLVDAGKLHLASENQLLQAVESEVLNTNVPSQLRSPENLWFGLTKRARVLVYHPDRVSPNELSTYQALTEPEWEGRVVTRTSTNIYSQSLTASMIAIYGETATREWVRGLVQNLAHSPRGNDRDQAKQVMAGEADVAIMNTYYMGRMLTSADPFEQEVAQTLRVFFPNQETTGTHINLSAAGVTKYAKNMEGAITFIEFLSSENAQGIFASANYEYPVNPRVEMDDLLKSWGAFKAQDINLALLGTHAQRAVIIMDEEGWE